MSKVKEVRRRGQRRPPGLSLGSDSELKLVKLERTYFRVAVCLKMAQAVNLRRVDGRPRGGGSRYCFISAYASRLPHSRSCADHVGPLLKDRYVNAHGAQRCPEPYAHRLFCFAATKPFSPFPAEQEGLLRSLLAQDPKLLNAKDVVSNLSLRMAPILDSWCLTGQPNPASLGGDLWVLGDCSIPVGSEGRSRFAGQRRLDCSPHCRLSAYPLLGSPTSLIPAVVLQ